MAKYRRRNPEIEAIQFTKPYKSALEFCPGAEIIKDGARVAYIIMPSAMPIVGSLNYITRRAHPGDYIVKLENGSYRTYQPHIFEQLYEEIEQ